MKTFVAAGLVLGLLSSAVSAQTAPPAVTTKTTVKAAKAAPGTFDRLNKRIREVSFTDLGFDQVVQWLANESGMQIVVRWQILTEAGIERDKAVTLNVKNLRFSQVLWMVMNEVGGADLKLAYRAAGGLIILSTAEDLGKEQLVRVYDVSDLLIRVRNFSDGPKIDIGNQTGGGGGGAGGGQNVFGGGQGGNQEEQEEQQTGNQIQAEPELDRLILIIQETVEPDTWETGGGQGTIRAFRKQLIVRNNILVHQMLGGTIAEGQE